MEGSKRHRFLAQGQLNTLVNKAYLGMCPYRIYAGAAILMSRRLGIAIEDYTVILICEQSSVLLACYICRKCSDLTS